MRDRTASRSYSPAAEQFRRDHERHRAWGLTQRYARKERGSHDRESQSSSPAPTSLTPVTRLDSAGSLIEIDPVSRSTNAREPGVEDRESKTGCTTQPASPTSVEHKQPGEMCRVGTPATPSAPPQAAARSTPDRPQDDVVLRFEATVPDHRTHRRRGPNEEPTESRAHGRCQPGGARSGCGVRHQHFPGHPECGIKQGQPSPSSEDRCSISGKEQSAQPRFALFCSIDGRVTAISCGRLRGRPLKAGRPDPQAQPAFSFGSANQCNFRKIPSNQLTKGRFGSLAKWRNITHPKCTHPSRSGQLRAIHPTGRRDKRHRQNLIRDHPKHDRVNSEWSSEECITVLTAGMALSLLHPPSSGGARWLPSPTAPPRAKTPQRRRPPTPTAHAATHTASAKAPATPPGRPSPRPEHGHRLCPSTSRPRQHPPPTSRLKAPEAQGRRGAQRQQPPSTPPLTPPEARPSPGRPAAIPT